jgi:hypothetical protein
MKAVKKIRKEGPNNETRIKTNDKKKRQRKSWMERRQVLYNRPARSPTGYHGEKNPQMLGVCA